MYKLIFFVPQAQLESVKLAVFNAGAGSQGEYDHCCWQTKGVGQFRPSALADPFIGKAGELERVDEWRVEMLCPKQKAGDVVTALKKAHPYEEVPFDLIELVTLES